MSDVLKEIFQGILNGQQAVVEERVKAAIQFGESPKIILDEGMIAAMTEVGRLFEQGEFYLPEMLIAARAMKAGQALLKPYLKNADVKSAGKVAIGTVKGDLHDIGKNQVGMMLEGVGFEVRGLGTDVSPDAFVSAAEDVQVIALSALLTTTMANMKEVVDALLAAGLRSKVKVIIGGAPVTDEFARLIGADGYAPDASQVATLAKSLLQTKGGES